MPSPTCNFCAHRNPDGSKFCNECGSPLNLVPCPQCEAINNASDGTCSRCGAPLVPTAQDAAAPASSPAGGELVPGEGPAPDDAAMDDAPGRIEPTPLALADRLDAVSTGMATSPRETRDPQSQGRAQDASTSALTQGDVDTGYTAARPAYPPPRSGRRIGWLVAGALFVAAAVATQWRAMPTTTTDAPHATTPPAPAPPAGAAPSESTGAAAPAAAPPVAPTGAAAEPAGAPAAIAPPPSVASPASDAPTSSSSSSTSVPAAPAAPVAPTSPPLPAPVESPQESAAPSAATAQSPAPSTSDRASTQRSSRARATRRVDGTSGKSSTRPATEAHAPEGSTRTPEQAERDAAATRRLIERELGKP